MYKDFDPAMVTDTGMINLGDVTNGLPAGLTGLPEPSANPDIAELPKPVEWAAVKIPFVKDRVAGAGEQMTHEEDCWCPVYNIDGLPTRIGTPRKLQEFFPNECRDVSLAMAIDVSKILFGHPTFERIENEQTNQTDYATPKTEDDWNQKQMAVWVQHDKNTN